MSMTEVPRAASAAVEQGHKIVKDPSTTSDNHSDLIGKLTTASTSDSACAQSTMSDDSFLELDISSYGAVLASSPAIMQQSARHHNSSAHDQEASSCSGSSTTSSPPNSVHDSALSEAGAHSMTTSVSSTVSDPSQRSAKDIIADLDTFISDITQRKPRLAAYPEVLNATRTRPTRVFNAPPAAPAPAVPTPPPPMPEPSKSSSTSKLFGFLKKSKSAAVLDTTSPPTGVQPAPQSTMQRAATVSGAIPVHTARPSAPPKSTPPPVSSEIEAAPTPAPVPSSTIPQTAAFKPRPKVPALPTSKAIPAPSPSSAEKRPSASQLPASHAFVPRTNSSLSAAQAFVPRTSSSLSTSQTFSPRPTSSSKSFSESRQATSTSRSFVAPGTTPSPDPVTSTAAADPTPAVDPLTEAARAAAVALLAQSSGMPPAETLTGDMDGASQRRARTTRHVVRVKRAKAVEELPVETGLLSKLTRRGSKPAEVEPEAEPEPEPEPQPQEPAGPPAKPISILELFEQHKRKFNHNPAEGAEAQEGLSSEGLEANVRLSCNAAFGMSSTESAEAGMISNKAYGSGRSSASGSTDPGDNSGRTGLPPTWRSMRPMSAAVLPDGKGDSPRDFEGGAVKGKDGQEPMLATVLDSSYNCLSSSSNGSAHGGDMRLAGEPRAPRSSRGGRPPRANVRGHVSSLEPFSVEDGSLRGGDPLSNFQNSWKMYRNMHNHFYRIEPQQRVGPGGSRPVFYAVASPKESSLKSGDIKPKRAKSRGRRGSPARRISGPHMPMVDSAASLMDLRQKAGSPSSDDQYGKGFSLAPMGAPPAPIGFRSASCSDLPSAVLAQ